MSLNEEAKRATQLLRGKKVSKVWRHRKKEIAIEFDDGARLFVDHLSVGLDVSITTPKESRRM